MMTKRAIHIKRFIDELADLAINSFFIRMHAYSCQPGEKEQHLLAKQYVIRKKANMMACMCEIMENNPEQAQALFNDLGLKWTEESNSSNNN